MPKAQKASPFRTTTAAGNAARRRSQSRLNTNPTTAAEELGQAQDLPEPSRRRLHHVHQPGLPLQLGRQVVGAVQRPEEVAGDRQVAEAPGERRGRHQQRQLDSGGPVARGEQPEPVRARVEPRLRPQQPGQAEQHEHRPAAPRTPRLEHPRPHHQRDLHQVHVAADPVVEERLAGGHDQRGEQPHLPGEQLLAEAEDPQHQRADPQDHDRQHHALARVPEQRRRDAHQHRQRMRGGRERHPVVGRAPVREIPAPEQRVERVVVQERPPEEGEDEQPDEPGGDWVEQMAPADHGRGT